MHSLFRSRKCSLSNLKSRWCTSELPQHIRCRLFRNLTKTTSTTDTGSAAMGRSNNNSMASKPEHLFSCPPNFFDSASLYRGGRVSSKEPPSVREDAGSETEQAHLRTGGILDLSALSVQEKAEREPPDGSDAGVAQRWKCVSCRATFLSSDEHRSHFKSDFHRLNVKRRVVGKEPISEEEFEVVAEGRGKGVDDDLSSISGSDSESDDPEQTFSRARGLQRSNRIFFILPDVKEILSLWRPVVIEEKEYLQGENGSSDSEDTGGLCVRDDNLGLRLRSLISSPLESGENSSHQPYSTWMVLLAAGGHFAGIVVKKKGGEVLAHHTFHRYVVRAKAGGRQSTQDKSGRAPKSAGASLRRHNEAALQREIRVLLNSWGGHLQSASHIFVHAPSANGQALFGGENAPLSRNDPRIRRIPFTTRRPTYKEAKRVHHVLATIAYEEETDLFNEMADGILDGKKEGTKKGLKTGDAQPGKKKEAVSTKSVDQSKSTADGPSSPNVSELSSSSGTEPGGNGSHKGGTRLHEAAKSGDCHLVLKLLEDGLDPRVKDEGGYTPYARAGDKETRNVFRRFMARYPDLWDWQAASVSSALTEEMEVAQMAKQAEKDMKRKEREKERKKHKKEQDRAKEAEKKAAELAAAALDSVRGTAVSKKTSKGSSTSVQSAGYQEALLKAQAEERERRAAAAEVRMRAMMANKESQPSQTLPDKAGSSTTASKSCSCCGDSLIGKTAFYRLSYQYCSTTCVQVHRKYLDSE